MERMQQTPNNSDSRKPEIKHYEVDTPYSLQGEFTKVPNVRKLKKERTPQK